MFKSTCLRKGCRGMRRHYILAHNKNTGSREDLREGHNSPFQDFRKHKAGGVIYSSKFSSGFICPFKDVLPLRWHSACSVFSRSCAPLTYQTPLIWPDLHVHSTVETSASPFPPQLSYRIPR